MSYKQSTPPVNFADIDDLCRPSSDDNDSNGDNVDDLADLEQLLSKYDNPKSIASPFVFQAERISSRSFQGWI